MDLNISKKTLHCMSLFYPSRHTTQEMYRTEIRNIRNCKGAIFSYYYYIIIIRHANFRFENMSWVIFHIYRYIINKWRLKQRCLVILKKRRKKEQYRKKISTNSKILLTNICQFWDQSSAHACRVKRVNNWFCYYISL